MQLIEVVWTKVAVLDGIFENAVSDAEQSVRDCNGGTLDASTRG